MMIMIHHRHYYYLKDIFSYIMNYATVFLIIVVQY